MNKHELMKCPFCNDDMSSFAGMTPEAFCRSSGGDFCIGCDCGVIGPSAKTMQGAIENWNSRAPVAQLVHADAAIDASRDGEGG